MSLTSQKKQAGQDKTTGSTLKKRLGVGESLEVFCLARDLVFANLPKKKHSFRKADDFFIWPWEKFSSVSGEHSTSFC